MAAERGSSLASADKSLLYLPALASIFTVDACAMGAFILAWQSTGKLVILRWVDGFWGGSVACNGFCEVVA